ncbi:MAG: glutamate 5-kinase [Planctomycetales bacterium]|nr:glutamate 5-kinase [Planctomycetales bacterium]
MTDLLRQEIAAASKRVVVKVGTRVLTRPDGRLNDERVGRLAEELFALKQDGRQVVLVSSGAVGAGMSQLKMTRRPTDLAKLQAVAAVGQARLTLEYDRHFRKHNCHAAQVLLTADDLDDRIRYLNVRNTLCELLEMGVIPIINENDTVAVEELMLAFGDNDRLAALVTNLLRASLLVILSDIDGLYDAPPDQPGASLVRTVKALDDTVQSYVKDRKNQLSKGGMSSKLAAARIVTSAGESMIIANGHQDGVIGGIFAGQEIGTLFLAQGKAISPLKRWIGFSAQSRGCLHLDQGASDAVRNNGKSLLPIGITQVEGDFGKGDIVVLCDPSGRQIGRGLINYTAEEARKLIGVRSDKIAEILGHCPYIEVVHRNNLIVM